LHKSCLRVILFYTLEQIEYIDISELCVHLNDIDPVLYENFDQILLNKLHGPMHYKTSVTSVYNGHVFYTLLL